MARTQHRQHRWKKHDAKYKEAVGTRLARWKRRKLAKLSEAQNHRCCYCCGETFLSIPQHPVPQGMSWDQRATIEHIIPISKSIQTNKDENLVMACSLCNCLRGDSDAFEFYIQLRKRNQVVDEPKKEPTEEQSAKKIEREKRSFAMCLIAVAMFPDDIAYLLKSLSDKPRARPKGGRSRKMNGIKRSMRKDSRCLVA